MWVGKVFRGHMVGFTTGILYRRGSFLVERLGWHRHVMIRFESGAAHLSRKRGQREYRFELTLAASPQTPLRRG